MRARGTGSVGDGVGEGCVCLRAHTVHMRAQVCVHVPVLQEAACRVCRVCRVQTCTE